jgi:hypothetical protein
MLEYVLPHVNFEKYYIINVEEKENEWRRKCTYRKRLFVTIEDKSWPPDDTWNRYAHWFIDREFDDWPLRNRALTIIERRKRRKNKKTWEVIKSNNEGVQVLEWTTKPEDVLFFLKMRK